MELLTINKELCIKCGICAEVCPNGIINMTTEGPQMCYAPACIGCGHCTAVCPKAALNNIKAPLSNQTQITKYPVINAETAATFLRSRRSIRSYKKDKITKEKVLQLLDISRFAPSGCNSQGLSYVIIENPDTLKNITKATISCMEEQIKAGVAWAKEFEAVTQIYRKTGADVVLRDAPYLILATAPSNFLIGHDNARFSLEYVELYATAMGLGTCWAGFVELAIGVQYKPLLEAMKIPDDTTVVGAMMLGYPKHTYERLVDRNPLQVTWIE